MGKFDLDYVSVTVWPKTDEGCNFFSKFFFKVQSGPRWKKKKRAESLAVPVWPVTPEKNIQNRRLRRQFELLASLFWKKKRGAGGKFSDLWNIKAILKCFHGAFYEEGKSSIRSKQKQLGLKSSMGGNVQPRLDSIPPPGKTRAFRRLSKTGFGLTLAEAQSNHQPNKLGLSGHEQTFPFLLLLRSTSGRRHFSAPLFFVWLRCASTLFLCNSCVFVFFGYLWTSWPNVHTEIVGKYTPWRFFPSNIVLVACPGNGVAPINGYAVSISFAVDHRLSIQKLPVFFL